MEKELHPDVHHIITLKKFEYELPHLTHDILTANHFSSTPKGIFLSIRGGAI